MIVQLRGCLSEEKDIPGSAPQGTLLGVVIYLLYINPIGFPGEATLHIHNVLTSYWQEFNVPRYDQLLDEFPYNLQQTKTVNIVKFMDDATSQEVIDINSALCSNIARSGPLHFHESSGKVLPAQNSLLQGEICKIKIISDRNNDTAI